MVGLRINLDGKGHVLQASKPQPVVLTLFSRGPTQSLCWEVVDGEGMVQTANRTLRLRAASAAASANLKRPMGVRLYPRALCFALALSCRH